MPTYILAYIKNKVKVLLISHHFCNNLSGCFERYAHMQAFVVVVIKPLFIKVPKFIIMFRSFLNPEIKLFFICSKRSFNNRILVWC